MSTSDIYGSLTKSDLARHEGSWVLIRMGQVAESGPTIESVLVGDPKIPDYIVLYISSNPIWR